MRPRRGSSTRPPTRSSGCRRRPGASVPLRCAAPPRCAGRGAAERDPSAAPADVVERMQAQAGVFGAAELSRAADLVNQGLTEMRGANSPRLQLELICARLMLPAAYGDERSVMARLDRIERGVNFSGGGAGPAMGYVPGPDAHGYAGG